MFACRIKGVKLWGVKKIEDKDPVIPIILFHVNTCFAWLLSHTLPTAHIRSDLPRAQKTATECHMQRAEERSMISNGLMTVRLRKTFSFTTSNRHVQCLSPSSPSPIIWSKPNGTPSSFSNDMWQFERPHSKARALLLPSGGRLHGTTEWYGWQHIPCFAKEFTQSTNLEADTNARQCNILTLKTYN